MCIGLCAVPRHRALSVTVTYHTSFCHLKNTHSSRKPSLTEPKGGKYLPLSPLLGSLQLMVLNPSVQDRIAKLPWGPERSGLYCVIPIVGGSFVGLSGLHSDGTLQRMGTTL